MKSLETQIAGQHYKNQKIQPIEYILENELPFIEGNIVKYITRWREKGGIEDLKKVKHYVEILMEHEDAKRNKTAVPPVHAKD
jgi:hypothetical protein